MQPTWSGRLIAIGRPADPRASTQKQLQRAGLDEAYARVAVGEAAARLAAHAESLGTAADGRWLHVVEEGTVLTSGFAGFAARLLGHGAFAAYDVVATDAALLVPNTFLLRKLKAAYDAAMAEAGNPRPVVIDLDFRFGGIGSYFVNPAGAAKVQAALRRALESGSRPDLDAAFAREQQEGRLRLGCAFPFLTRVSLRRTGVASGPVPAEALASHLFRHAFAVEYDANEIAGALAPVVGKTSRDRHLELVLGILGVMIGR